MAREYDPTVVTGHTRVLPTLIGQEVHRPHTLDSTIYATSPRDPLPVSTGHPLSVFTDTSIGVATHIELRSPLRDFGLESMAKVRKSTRWCQSNLRIGDRVFFGF